MTVKDVGSRIRRRGLMLVLSSPSGAPARSMTEGSTATAVMKAAASDTLVQDGPCSCRTDRPSAPSRLSVSVQWSRLRVRTCTCNGSAATASPR